MNNLLTFISLIKKSGNLKSGETNVLNAIKSSEAKLVILAKDTSDNTKKKFSDKCKFYDIKIVDFSEMEMLGKAIGKDFCASIAICDEGLRKAFMDKYGRYINGENENI